MTLSGQRAGWSSAALGNKKRRGSKERGYHGFHAVDGTNCCNEQRDDEGKLRGEMHLRLIYVNTWLGVDRLSNASKFGRNPDVATHSRAAFARSTARGLLASPRAQI